MIHLKSDVEIGIISEGGRRLRRVVNELRPIIKAGITTRQIDIEAETLIKKRGGEPSFKRVPGYKWSTCLPVNEQIVHTPPSDRKLIDGDIVTLDIGMYYKGFHTDYADTVAIGTIDKKTEKFLRIGKNTLNSAIRFAEHGKRIGGISREIEKHIVSNGYYIIRELTGHGIGKELHEDPYVPGFLDGPIDKTLLIKPGLVVAIEVIYAVSTNKMVYEEGSDWSIQTHDKSLSACFEHTVVITNTKSLILT